MKKFRMTYKEIYFNERGFMRERYRQIEVVGKSVNDIFKEFEKAGYTVVFVDEL